LKWDDLALLVGIRPFGEGDALAHFLTFSHGLACGLIKGGQSRRMRPFLMPGNSFDIEWKGRLAEQLGFFSAECTLQRAPRIMAAGPSDRAAAILSAACAVLCDALPQMQPNHRVFENTLLLFDDPRIDNYALWERELLAELGFRMALDKCNATGSCEDLVYISPKTGHAISRGAGEPYKHLLLKMPRVWASGFSGEGDDDDWREALRVLEFFLDSRVYSLLKKEMPWARRAICSL
jgi:DNA repair protein RecO (recombination protein O)